jgi:hypothetical protein
LRLREHTPIEIARTAENFMFDVGKKRRCEVKDGVFEVNERPDNTVVGGGRREDGVCEGGWIDQSN